MKPADTDKHPGAQLRRWPRLSELVDTLTSAMEARAAGAQDELDAHLDALEALVGELEQLQTDGRPPWER